MPELTTILTFGLIAACFALLVQAVVPFDWKLKKPWGCVFCLSVHGAWITLAAYRAAVDPSFYADPWTLSGLRRLAEFTAIVAGAVPVSMLAVKAIKVLTKIEEG